MQMAQTCESILAFVETYHLINFTAMMSRIDPLCPKQFLILEQSKHLNELRRLLIFEWNLTSQNRNTLDEIDNVQELRELLLSYGTTEPVNSPEDALA